MNFHPLHGVSFSFVNECVNGADASDQRAALGEDPLASARKVEGGASTFTGDKGKRRLGRERNSGSQAGEAGDGSAWRFDIENDFTYFGTVESLAKIAVN